MNVSEPKSEYNIDGTIYPIKTAQGLIDFAIYGSFTTIEIFSTIHALIKQGDIEKDDNSQFGYSVTEQGQIRAEQLMMEQGCISFMELAMLVDMGGDAKQSSITLMTMRREADKFKNRTGNKTRGRSDKSMKRRSSLKKQRQAKMNRIKQRTKK